MTAISYYFFIISFIFTQRALYPSSGSEMYATAASMGQMLSPVRLIIYSVSLS